MTRRIVAGISLMLVLAGGERAVPQPLSHVVRQPDWRAKPTADELVLAYPEQALAQHLEGNVVLRCRVRATGKATDCQVAQESPIGYGFGASALKMAESFDMTPLTIDGAPSDDGEVTIPIKFSEPKPLLLSEPEPLPAGSSWYKCPSDGKSTDRYYPRRAQVFGVQGVSTIQCRLRPAGEPSECAWLTQTPPNFEFGEAAQKLGCLIKYGKIAAGPTGELPLLKESIKFRLPP
jgi:TonB family protein